MFLLQLDGVCLFKCSSYFQTGTSVSTETCAPATRCARTRPAASGVNVIRDSSWSVASSVEVAGNWHAIQ